MIIFQNRFNPETQIGIEGFVLFNTPKSGADCIEVALRKHAKKADILTDPSPYSPYLYKGQNQEQTFHHMKLEEYMKKWPNNQLKRVFVLRDPLDINLELYFMERTTFFSDRPKHLKSSAAYRKAIRDFRKAIVVDTGGGKHFPLSFFDAFKRFPTYWNLPKSNALTEDDIVLRYEHLQEDFNIFCNTFDIPQTRLDLSTYESYDRATYLTRELAHHIKLDPNTLGNFLLEPEQVIRNVEGLIHRVSNLIYTNDSHINGDGITENSHKYQKLTDSEKKELVSHFFKNYMKPKFNEFFTEQLNEYYS